MREVAQFFPYPETLIAEVRALAHVKRFMEYWASDDTFRDALAHGDLAVPNWLRCSVDPNSIRPLWDPAWRDWVGGGPPPAHEPPPDTFPLAVRFIEVRERRADYCREIRDTSRPEQPAFRAWRRRQVARAKTQFPGALFTQIQHIPFAVELSSGCSVGCWFCGVGALKLSAQFHYEGENVALWHDLLRVIQEVAGDATGSRSLLYWATDPLDNPDYELFARDFEEALGSFPYTTTAQPMRHVDRIRRIVETAASRQLCLRFSILSIEIFKKLCAEFTADELALVDFAPQTPGSYYGKVRAGKARDVAAESAKGRQLYPEEDARTIACVSGFVVNLVERTVSLVTPVPASDRWPFGYCVYARDTFENGDDLAVKVRRMIDDQLIVGVRPYETVRFRKDLRLEPLPDGFKLSGHHGEHRFTGNPFFAEVGAMIDTGTSTPASIADAFYADCGFDRTIVLEWLDGLFGAGVLDEEPGVAAVV